MGLLVRIQVDSRSPARLNSHRHHHILQCANAADRDRNFVLLCQRERLRRNDACAGEQHGAVRKVLAAKKKSGQFFETALDLSDGGFARETDVPVAPNVTIDVPYFLCSNNLQPFVFLDPVAVTRTVT